MYTTLYPTVLIYCNKLKTLNCLQDWSDLVEFVVQKCLNTKQIKVPSFLMEDFQQDEVKVPEPVPRDIIPLPLEDPPTELVKSFSHI